MGNAQSAVAASSSPCFEDEYTTTIHESLRSFTLFTRLPLELQGKIWTHALEPPRITPQVVRVRHDATTNSFSYSFTIPHMMEVCRLSRQIAQKSYPSLLPGLPSPVYINPAVDFLYCISTLDPSNTPGRVEDLSVLSFLSAASNAEAIRFLVLDLSFWSHRMATTTAGTCPIPELRSFSTIEELFLVVPSLEQWLENQRRVSAAFPHRPDDPRFDVDAKYAAEVARHEAAPDAIVPDFRVYREGFDCLRNLELKRCFGVQDQPPLNPNMDPGLGNNNSGNVEPMDQSCRRRVPKWTEIRAITK